MTDSPSRAELWLFGLGKRARGGQGVEIEVVQQSPLIALLDATESALDAKEAEGGAERAALLLQDRW
jgi:hypothetical protein